MGSWHFEFVSKGIETLLFIQSSFVYKYIEKGKKKLLMQTKLGNCT